MSYPVYTVYAGDVLPIFFDSFDGGTGASITMTGLAVTDIEIYKDGNKTQRASDAGYTLLDTDGIDFDDITGIHGFSIDTGDNTDAGFFSVGSWFHVVVSSITIDGQTVNFIAAAFRIVAAEVVAGVPLVDTKAILGTALTETSGGYLAAGFKKLFDVASPVLTAASVNQTGDAYLRLGSPAGASIAADLVAIDNFVDDIETRLTATRAGYLDIINDWVNGGRLDLILDGIEAHVHTIDGHITADYGATEKTAIDLLDDAAGGLADIHTDIADIHTDVADLHTDIGTVVTNVGDVHATDLPAVKTVVDAVKVVTDKLGTALEADAAVYRFTANALEESPAGSAPTKEQIRAEIDTNSTQLAAIVADTNELQTDLVNGGRLDLILDGIETHVHATDGHVTADYGASEKAAIDLLDDVDGGIGDVHAVVNAVKAKTDNLPADPADDSDIDSQLAAIAGYLDTEVAAILADTNELQGDLTDGGRLDLLVDAIKAKTDNLPADPADDSDIDAQLAIIAGYLDTEVAAILADTNEIQTDLVNGGRLDLLIDAIKAKTDNLPADPADDSDIDSQLAAIKAIADKVDTAVELDGAVYRFTANALEEGPAAAITALAIRQEMDANSTQLAAIKAKTDNLPADPADDSDIDTQLAAIAGYLDTEVAAILADTAELQGDLTDGGRLDLLIDAIKAKTDNLPASPAATGAKMDLVDVPNATALNAVSDDFLDRDMGAGADTNTRSPRNTFRAIRNKVSKADTGVITVTKEDDATPAWTLVQKTTVDNDPV